MTEPDLASEAPDIDGEMLDALEAHLREHAVGKTNAVVSDELADIIESQDSHDTNPTVRDACRALLFDRAVPVKGGPTGFYIPTPGEEFDAAEQSIKDQIGALNTRLIALREARESFNYAADPEPPSRDEPATESDTGGCENCGGPIQDDPYLWESAELCRDCWEDASGYRPRTDA